MTKIDLTKTTKEKVIYAIKETLENEKDVDPIAKEELTYYMDFVVEFLEGGESILKKPLHF
ncbi:MAG: hypothetical protein ACPLWB_00040 [Caldisericia bacterium]